MSSADADKSKTPSDATAVFRAVAAVSVLLFASRLAPLVFPDVRLWGFNHLIFLPVIHMIIYIGVGVLCLATVVPSVREWLFDRFCGVGEYLFGDKRYLKWAGVGIVLLPIFWFLRMPTNLLGDGYTVIKNIAGDQPTIFKWSETGAVAVVYLVSRLLPVDGVARGEYAYAIVSVISGSVSVFFFFGIAHELGKDAASRLFGACLLLISGWSLLFYGYAENYPVLWPTITGYIYFSIRYLAGKGGIIVSLAFAIAAAALHLQTLFYLPSLAVIILGRGIGKRLYIKYPGTARAILAAVAAIAVAVFVWRYHRSISFAVHFLPILSGRPATPDYAMFSLNHLLDMANELLLLLPLLPVMIVLGWDGLKRTIRDTTGVFLLVFACGGIILLLILDPRIGMGRDWDLFATSGLGVMLLLLWATIRADGIFKRLYPSLVALASLLVFPFFAVNLTAKPSIDYMKWLLDLDKNKSTSGMVMLRDYYLDTGDVIAADSLELIIVDRKDIIEYGNRAMDHVKAGRFREAMAVVDTVFRIDPYSRESYNLRGAVYFDMGRYDSAIADYETSLEMEPYDFRVLVNLARAYYQIGQDKPMMEYLRRAEELNPDAGLVLQAMAMGFLAKQQYDSAYVYGRRLLAVDSTVANGYLAIGLYFISTGAGDSAAAYLVRYVSLVGPGPDRDRAIDLLGKIEQTARD